MENEQSFTQLILNPENIIRVFTSAVIGTTAMTVYSYARSGAENKDFREPHLLNVMIDHFKLGIKKPTIAGWILHYKVGYGFASVYHILWRKNIRPNLMSGIGFGAISGFFGILAWDTVIRLHPNPPAIDRKAFYQHLFIAHIVFGAFAYLGYRKSEKKLSKNQ